MYPANTICTCLRLCWGGRANLPEYPVRSTQIWPLRLWLELLLLRAASGNKRSRTQIPEKSHRLLNFPRPACARVSLKETVAKDGSEPSWDLHHQTGCKIVRDGISRSPKNSSLKRATVTSKLLTSKAWTQSNPCSHTLKALWSNEPWAKR